MAQALQRKLASIDVGDPHLYPHGLDECCHCERSEAIHRAAQRKNGLLRRFAPLRKRFAFVAGNDKNC